MEHLESCPPIHTPVNLNHSECNKYTTTTRAPPTRTHTYTTAIQRERTRLSCCKRERARQANTPTKNSCTYPIWGTLKGRVCFWSSQSLSRGEGGGGGRGGGGGILRTCATCGALQRAISYLKNDFCREKAPTWRRHYQHFKDITACMHGSCHVWVTPCECVMQYARKKPSATARMTSAENRHQRGSVIVSPSNTSCHVCTGHVRYESCHMHASCDTWRRSHLPCVE